VKVRRQNFNSQEEKEENFRRVERQYGSFTRSFTLPSSVDTGQVSANYDKGVLKIRTGSLRTVRHPSMSPTFPTYFETVRAAFWRSKVEHPFIVASVLCCLFVDLIWRNLLYIPVERETLFRVSLSVSYKQLDAVPAQSDRNRHTPRGIPPFAFPPYEHLFFLDADEQSRIPFGKWCSVNQVHTL
jgi:Hsp20/alpha crystallin family